MGWATEQVSASILYEPSPPPEQLRKMDTLSGDDAIKAGELAHVVHQMSASQRQDVCEQISSHYRNPEVSLPIINKLVTRICGGGSKEGNATVPDCERTPNRLQSCESQPAMYKASLTGTGSDRTPTRCATRNTSKTSDSPCSMRYVRLCWTCAIFI